MGSDKQGCLYFVYILFIGSHQILAESKNFQIYRGAVWISADIGILF